MYEKDSDKRVCQVRISKNEEEVICGKKLSGMYASNMKKHLKLQHKEAFKKFEEEENERSKSSVSKRKRDSNSTTSQLTIKETLRPTLHPKDSKKQKAITRKSALFVGSTQCSFMSSKIVLNFETFSQKWTASTTYLIKRSWVRKLTRCTVIYSLTSPLFWSRRNELAFVATYGQSRI